MTRFRLNVFVTTDSILPDLTNRAGHSVRSLLYTGLLLISQTALSYNYQEHKAIGNAALTQALARLVAEGRFADSTAATRLMETQILWVENP